MSASEVFRPKNGPLVLRGNLSDGPPIPMDTFRKDERPGTQTSRWGKKSINQFFARNAPHTSRVKHLKGLLDVPICTVTDPGVFGAPKTPLQFPPNSYENKKLKVWRSLPKLPVNAIGLNNQMHPKMSLDKRIFREKAVPNMGMVPVIDAWERELFSLAQALQLDKHKPPPVQKPDSRARYSENTGRLIPPPSRAMTRGSSRGSRCDLRSSQYQHIVPQPDISGLVLQMLCQVLQTDDVNAVKAWLVSAPDQEKASVLNMIHAALQSNDDYYNHNVNAKEQDFVGRTELPAEGAMLPAIDETERPESMGQKTVDRLNFEPTVPTNQDDNLDGTHFRYTYTPMGGQRKIPTPLFEETNPQLTVGDTFLPPKSGTGLRPRSNLDQLNRKTPVPPIDQPKLRMVTPKMDENQVWNQDNSLAA
ncbi:hypothetical protein CAPTEDRAFT_221402 [Capitella teleta]|uniref:Protein TBATA n=1 Tax=Capitella teleta TaxID=283909 RepID=R7V1C7_CAPTE|nr:hypothetical protein CAPTEDRAFT_221402 [Capitella teleta]|eukprot:ELU10012.1 hypothetical protein CAPTEDRAFT_221402 [Capitella teleta]